MSELNDLVSERNSLRLELHTLRFKESEERRFIWWVREVFAKKVQDTVAGIIEACTYQDEPTAAAGKYGLPIKCFEMMHSLTESTHGIYDGTYLDVEIYNHTDIVDEMSVDVKNQKSLGDEVMEIIGDALSGDCQKYLNYDLHGKRYCKWGIVEKDIRALLETSTDNNKCWWSQESDPEVFPDLWRTNCGNSFYLDAEKPSDNHMKYCCYCGKEIAEGE